MPMMIGNLNFSDKGEMVFLRKLNLIHNSMAKIQQQDSEKEIKKEK